MLMLAIKVLLLSSVLDVRQFLTNRLTLFRRLFVQEKSSLARRLTSSVSAHRTGWLIHNFRRLTKLTTKLAVWPFLHCLTTVDNWKWSLNGHWMVKWDHWTFFYTSVLIWPVWWLLDHCFGVLTTHDHSKWSKIGLVGISVQKDVRWYATCVGGLYRKKVSIFNP